MRQVAQSSKLRHVRYDVGGLILEEAYKLEAEGRQIMKLNIGNPAVFGFKAPESILTGMIHDLPEAHGVFRLCACR
ncbi:hypothetical protein [Nonomuraea sp. NPDC049141]|uniref:hypothetical protein n=1 Tax=Nonomuraea sp. NPDC049141 TaxID=3155500 RepID=UPI0033F300EB